MGKLVRDNIPAILTAKDVPFRAHVLAPEAYRASLREKLREETGEYLSATTDEDRLAEGADVLEVVLADLGQDGYTLEDLLEARDSKRAERGGFDERIFLS